MTSDDKSDSDMTDKQAQSDDAQEPASQQPTTTTTRQHARHRASVACASCRDRRIRCVVPPGEAACTQCQRAGAACVIKNDDERRRPISKAYMSSLSRRIALLEGMLAERGVVPPPAVHPPKTRHEVQRDADSVTVKQETVTAEQESVTVERECITAYPCPAVAQLEAASNAQPVDDRSGPESVNTLAGSPPPLGQPTTVTAPPDDLVQRLLSSSDTLPLYQLSNQLSSHASPTVNDAPPDLIQSLSPATHDYLLDCFWTGYNDCHAVVVDRDAFSAARHDYNAVFYSRFLHATVLAMGYRFADRSRDDVKQLRLGCYESTLQREARRLLDNVLQGPAGLPAVQGLLLLSDLECAVGRDNAGWMYASMAHRLALDAGLHRDGGGSNDISNKEASTRHMVARALRITDMHWAVFLGRPTGNWSQGASREQPCRPLAAAATTTRNEEIRTYLAELTELAGNMVGGSLHDNSPNDNSPADTYLAVMGTDRLLRSWYRRLPAHVAWTPANVKDAPACFFLLHQQYHALLLQLHRPWGRYNSSIGDASQSTLSRGICTQQAAHVARILLQQQLQAQGRPTAAASVQHAAAAAMALVAALAGHQHHHPESRVCLGYLDIVAHTLHDMGRTYAPASRMLGVLTAVRDHLRGSISGGSIETKSARRKNPDDADTLPAAKRRRRSMADSSTVLFSVFSPPQRAFECGVEPLQDSSWTCEPPAAVVDDWLLDGPSSSSSSSSALDSPGSTATPRSSSSGSSSSSATLDKTTTACHLAAPLPLPLGPAAKMQGALGDDPKHILDWMDPSPHVHTVSDKKNRSLRRSQRPSSIVGFVLPAADKASRHGAQSRGAAGDDQDEEGTCNFDFLSL